jgi:hypothetical protein
MIREFFRVVHASRVLVSASRRNKLFELTDDRQEFRNREDAIASTQDACATNPLKRA